MLICVLNREFHLNESQFILDFIIIAFIIFVTPSVTAEFTL